MELNEAYNAVELNPSTANEAVYEICEPRTKSRGKHRKKATIVTTAQDLHNVNNVPITPYRNNNTVLRITKQKFLCGVFGALSILAFAMALSGLVLSTAHYTAQMHTLNKILSTVENTSNRVQVLPPSDVCGGPGWQKVRFVDMNDPNQDCPQGLSETGYSIRSCGATHNEVYDGCSSVMFPTGNSPYRYVCGRVTAYRYGNNRAFIGYHNQNHLLNAQYVDGLSFTHGSPRTHIWTFASRLFSGSNSDINSDNRCPCDEGNTYSSPPFVANDYFCESVATVDNWNVNQFRFYPDDALWDGKGCQDNSNACCLFNNPPWFKKTLPNPTSDDIELRVCFFNGISSSNIGIEQLELYVN